MTAFLVIFRWRLMPCWKQRIYFSFRSALTMSPFQIIICGFLSRDLHFVQQITGSAKFIHDEEGVPDVDIDTTLQ